MLPSIDIETNMDFMKYIEDTVAKIAVLQENMIANGNVAEFKDVFDYHRFLRGKAIRPSLCRLICNAMNGNQQESLYFGLGVELLHGASLFHDDVIDDDTYRRGKLAVHERFNISKAILSGDLLAAFGFDSLFNIFTLQHAVSGGKEFVRAVNRLARGALVEHLNTRIEQVTDENVYMQMIGHKTAALYSISARLGAIAADASPEDEKRAADFGEACGMAFQITDDIVDVVKSQKAGYPVGDMTEGKMSLPLIYAYHKDVEVRPAMKRYIAQRGNSGIKLAQEDFETIINSIKNNRIYDFVDERVSDFIVASKQQCLAFPRNDYTAALYNFAEFACGALRKEMDS